MQKLKNSNNKVLTTKWFEIDKVPCSPTNNEPYYRLLCSDSVEIIAVTPEKKIVLVRQFRPAIGIYMLELPAGHINKKESSKKAAQRELKEETGFVCPSVTHIGNLVIHSSRVHNKLHSFYGKDAKLSKNVKNIDAEVVLLSEAEFKKAILKGEFFETAGLATYLLSKLRGVL